MARDQARTEPAFAPPRHESGTVPKRHWVLERGAERIPLPLGESVIGRGGDVDILVDNHRVSRRHAKITVNDSGVYVEDLGSVNGVRVDGVAVHGRLRLSPGMRISIADEAFDLTHTDRLEGARATQRVPTQDAHDGHPADITTRRTHAFQMMLGVVDKAIALGKPDEAERLLGTLLSEVLDEAQKSGEVPTEIAVAAVQAAQKLARATGKSQWVEYPLRLFLARRALLPLEAVDELFAIARRASRLDLALLRRYVAMVDGLELGAGDRFVLSRLHNLANMLGAVSPR
ncbi:MAG: FHA domain-containing protein [Polyangiaceae bacterium]|nr:FHA domain-containing protein [Polyangiaceae bacterium]